MNDDKKSMGISKEEYFFYEWLILEKGVTNEVFKDLTRQDFISLRLEYEQWKNNCT